MFLSYNWTSLFQVRMIVIGVIMLLISLTTFIANIISAIKGTTTGVKKIIVAQWILALILMIISEIIAIATYFQLS